MGDHKETDATAKATQKFRGSKSATAADKWVTALGAELAEAKGSHAWLVAISAQCEADATKAQVDLGSCKVHFGKVEQATRLADASLDDARKQSAKSAKVAEEALRHLTEMSTRAQLLEDEISSLKLQVGEIVKTRDDAISSAIEQSRQLRMLEVHINL